MHERRTWIHINLSFPFQPLIIRKNVSREGKKTVFRETILEEFPEAINNPWGMPQI